MPVIEGIEGGSDQKSCQRFKRVAEPGQGRGGGGGKWANEIQGL